MKFPSILVYSLTIGSLLISVGSTQAQDPAQPGPPIPATTETPQPSLPQTDETDFDNADGEALQHGPIHEAFAVPVSENPEPGIVVQKQPPQPIEELPPEIKPSGSNVEWISGYWAWDDDKQDFLWISGVWRKIPSGMRWVPGYWQEVDQGYQWISGTWIPEEQTELRYLPTPPESLDNGPTAAAPSNNHFWVPGNWVYQTNHYVWRPGFWSIGYDNWTWIPARYSWTPRGCLYLSGYWDYNFRRRGYLYAPYYFRRPVYRNAGFYYTPRLLINLGIVFDHFWVRPRYHHYYFGNYYGARYAKYGIRPWWYDSHRRRGHYDPFYSYHRRIHQQRHAHLGSYASHLEKRYRHYANHRDLQPNRSYRAHTSSHRHQDGRRDTRSNFLARPVNSLQVDRNRNERLNSDQRQRARQQASSRDRIVNARRTSERFSRDVRASDNSVRSSRENRSDLQRQLNRPRVERDKLPQLNIPSVAAKRTPTGRTTGRTFSRDQNSLQRIQQEALERANRARRAAGTDRSFRPRTEATNRPNQGNRSATGLQRNNGTFSAKQSSPTVRSFQRSGRTSINPSVRQPQRNAEAARNRALESIRRTVPRTSPSTRSTPGQSRSTPRLGQSSPSSRSVPRSSDALSRFRESIGNRSQAAPSTRSRGSLGSSRSSPSATSSRSSRPSVGDIQSRVQRSRSPSFQSSGRGNSFSRSRGSSGRGGGGRGFSGRGRGR